MGLIEPYNKHMDIPEDEESTPIEMLYPCNKTRVDTTWTINGKCIQSLQTFTFNKIPFVILPEDEETTTVGNVG